MCIVTYRGVSHCRVRMLRAGASTWLQGVGWGEERIRRLIVTLLEIYNFYLFF